MRIESHSTNLIFLRKWATKSRKSSIALTREQNVRCSTAFTGAVVEEECTSNGRQFVDSFFPQSVCSSQSLILRPTIGRQSPLPVRFRKSTCMDVGAGRRSSHGTNGTRGIQTYYNPECMMVFLFVLFCFFAQNSKKIIDN